MVKTKIDRAFVSVVDKYLQEYHATNPKSAAENREIAKSQRITTLRDDASADDLDDNIWEGFYN